jgi:hypothetical protein
MAEKRAISSGSMLTVAARTVMMANVSGPGADGAGAIRRFQPPSLATI